MSRYTTSHDPSRVPPRTSRATQPLDADARESVGGDARGATRTREDGEDARGTTRFLASRAVDDDRDDDATARG